jgi:hypothetical protein
MMIRRPTLALVVSVVALGTALSCKPSQAPAREGRLLVVVVVDQLRSDYLDRYTGFWKEGFARLLDDGAVFERSAYPYMNTVTCAGHATIATGALPSTHGVIMNEWWHRDVGARMACTVDPEVKSVVYGGAPEQIGHSAFRLRIPTLGDRLRAASPQSRVVTLSLKARSAVMLAGHGGTAVTWFSDTDTWATSTAFTSSPVREVQAHVSASPVDRYRGEIWNRVHDPRAYSGVDDAVGERPPAGWTTMFAHPLAGEAVARADRFHNLWKRSPYSDVELGEMAAALVRSMELGQRGVVDYLGVSFSALDYIGHNFGPDSHEVQDTLIRLDRTLGRFLTMLDETVGKDRYVLALSSDHGVGFIPEALNARGQEAGRVLSDVLRKTAEAAMVAAHGPGPHVAHVEYTEVYFTDTTRKLVTSQPQALEPLIAALERVPGVLRAMSTHDLPSKRSSSHPGERAAALGHYPGVSGDVQILVKPNWVGTNTSAASHGTFHAYDQQVPVIFFGNGIDAGRYADVATPADIAPTLASLIELALPGVDGKVLKRALK